MMDNYVICELQPDNALSALALVCSVAPAFDEKDWSALFDGSRRWRCIGASDLAGRVRGLAVFRFLMHPQVGWLMDVPIFIALSAADQNHLAESLFASLEIEASACQFMRVWNKLPESLDELEGPELFRRWNHGLIYRVRPQERGSASL